MRACDLRGPGRDLQDGRISLAEAAFRNQLQGLPADASEPVGRSRAAGSTWRRLKELAGDHRSHVGFSLERFADGGASLERRNASGGSPRPRPRHGLAG